ncbi:hypothetical protein GW835_04015 [archaeon]|nr:hypothetical protein [archaeon]NCP79704.1 hypothetical protein [archaeon]NCP97994.1 hypothetical protein [archaeon]NCQ07470.1 hypothetical protein [archaeon]NCQ51261.1 hypothetical protein [archaeon]
MNKQAGLSILLVVLILGSIVGMSIGARPDVDTTYQDFEEDLNIPSEMYVGETEAIVSEMFSELIIASNTDVFEQTKIENDLIAIEGVKRSSIQFNKDSEEKIILIAKIVIDPLLQEEIITEINNLEYLTSEPIEIYKQARVEINNSVNFRATSDENKTMDYDFVDYIVDAVVNVNTLKKDNIQGQLQASFKGEVLEYVILYETTNLTSSPSLVFDEQEINILEWNEKYRYSTKTNYLNDNDENSIKEKINEIEKVTIVPDYSLVYQGLDINVSKEDLNISEIESIDKNIEEIKISFIADYNLSNYTEIKEKLIENGFLEENKVKDFEKKYLLESSVEIENIIEKITPLDLELEEIEKEAILDVEKITLQEEEYTYSEKTYPVWLEYPEDINKEIINFNVQAYVTRKDIMFLMLDKKIEE